MTPYPPSLFPLPQSPFHLDFRIQTFLIAEDRSNGEGFVPTHESNDDVPVYSISIDVDAIPLLGVPHVVDAHVVVRTPEKRNLIEPLARAEDVSGGDLSVTLGKYPVLDANPFAGVRIWPPRDIAGGKHARHTRLEPLIHRHTFVHRQTGLLGKVEPRPDT